MSVTASNAVFDYSRSKGAGRLVLLALAKHVNEQKLEQYEEALAWPSQNTMARLCNCSRSTVQRGLDSLVAIGEIKDTGERRTRDTVVWEILIENMRVRHDLTHPGSGQANLTQDGSGEGSEGDDLTHPARDLTDSGDDLTHPASSPDSTLNHKQEVEVEVKKEEIKSSPPPADLDGHSSLTEKGNNNSTKAQRLAERKELEDRRTECEELLGQRPKDRLLAAGLETANAELAALDGQVAA